MHERFVWSSVHVMLQEAEKKNGVGMALDVATLPLILYRKVYNHLACITLREHHTHSYLVLLLCHSYSIFFISNVFSTCSCPFSLHSLSIIDII